MSILYTDDLLKMVASEYPGGTHFRDMDLEGGRTTVAETWLEVVGKDAAWVVYDKTDNLTLIAEIFEDDIQDWLVEADESLS